MLSLEKTKELIVFARENGVRHFTLADMSVEFFSQASSTSTHNNEPAKASEQEQPENVDELLFASAGY